MFEYGVDFAVATSPEDMKFVADAFNAGQKKQQDRIWAMLEPMFPGYDNIYISKEELKKIVYGN